VRLQTKRDTLVLQVGGLGIGLTSQSRKNKFVEKTIQLKFQRDGCLGGPSGMEEHCIGSQSPQRTVVLEKKKKKKNGLLETISNNVMEIQNPNDGISKKIGINILFRMI
jgi:hypothetical protein